MINKKAAVKAVRLLIAGVSSVAFFMGNVSAHAVAPSTSSSPLFAQTKGTQATVAQIVRALKNSAAGKITSANAKAAFISTIAANPGVPMTVFVAALNQLNLTGAPFAE